MKETLPEQAAKLKQKSNRHKRWKGVISILACVVVFCTVYALILPALTAEGTPHCGKEEHTHTEDCYEQKLICGKQEGDGAHHHTDACYTEEKTLICGQEEGEGAHHHTENCYDEEGNLICGQQESNGHRHTDACYKTDRVLTCGQEENDGHHHTEDCYEKELVCGKEEHTHTLACYSDPNADVEDESVWQNTVSSVTLTGNWGKDLADVAKTQNGYKESTSNYVVMEDGATMSGYTRYGAWAGEPYRDNWSAQFIDFCLSYAGIPTSAMTQPTDCQGWGSVSKEGYTPNTGDLIILDGNKDGTADHAGIVLSSNDTQTTAVIGDSDKEVKTNTYNLDNEIILGYVTMPKNPDFDYGDTEPDKKVDDAEDNKDQNGDIEIKEDDSVQDDTNNVEETPTPGTNKPHKAPTKNSENNNSVAQNMRPYITGITGSGTIYDKDGDIYSSDLKLNFKFSKEDIQSKGYIYYYEYADGIIIPDKLIDGQKHELNDGAGTYRFEKTSDGKYRVIIEFDENYVEDAGTIITGNVEFSGKVSGDKGDKEGNIEVKGKDGVDLVIPKNEITYPSDETNAYDISVSKSGTYQIKDGKLVYTVYVSSLKGTPSTIDFNDKINVSGLTLKTPPTISVTKEMVPSIASI